MASIPSSCARRSYAEGLICPIVECRRRWRTLVSRLRQVGDILGVELDGGYRFTSAEPHFPTVTIFARKDGYESGETKSVACCATAGDTRFDVRLRRIVGITIDGPGTLAVGEGARLAVRHAINPTRFSSRVSSSAPSLSNSTEAGTIQCLATERIASLSS